jgi:hypothetical protein
MTYTTHKLAYLTTDGSGNGGLLLTPQYMDFAATVCTATSGGVLTPATNFTAEIPVGDVSRYRIVSAGYKISSVAAPLNASGTVGIRCRNDVGGGNYAAIEGLAYGVADYIDIPLRLADGVAVVPTRLTNPRPEFFTATAGGGLVTSWSAPGYGAVTITLTGGPASTACLAVEILIHYELIFDEAAGMTLAMTPSPPSNPMQVAASNAVSTVGRSIFERGMDAASSYIRRAAETALISYFPEAGLPIAAMRALTVD